MTHFSRLLRLIPVLVVLPTGAYARGRVQGWCEQGNQTVSVAGNQPSTTKVQRSYPGCTINVYAIGTTTHVTIYSDLAGTALGNPFTASTSTGYWNFYTDSQEVDVNLSGAGISVPYTRGSIPVSDPVRVLSDSQFFASGNPLSTACSLAVSQNLTLMIGNHWTPSSLNCAADLQFVTGGIIEPANGQTVTFSGNIYGDLSQHFSRSSGGSIAISNVQTLFPEWFGAKLDGMTDDAAAWNNTIGSCAGCTIRMRTNATSYVGSTINLSGSGQRMVCEGKSSIITGTGISILKMSGSASGGQTLENCQIQDSTGNASTTCLLLDNGSGNVNQVFINNVSCFGASGNRVGLGLKLNGSVNVHLDNFVSQYWGKGIITANTIPGNTTFRIDRSNIASNATCGMDLETSGDTSAYGSNFEGNGTYGICANNNNLTLSLYSNHFEANTSGALNHTAGKVFASDNSWEGEPITVGDSGGNTQFVSNYEQFASVTFTNNATTAFAGSPTAILNYPFNLSVGAIAGSGWSRVLNTNGLTDLNNPSTSYFSSGALNYTFKQPVIVSNGTRFTLANNGGPCNGTPATAGNSTSGYFTPGAGTTVFPATCVYTLTVGGASPISAPNGWQITGTNAANAAPVAMITSNATTVQFKVLCASAADQIFISIHDPF